MSRPNRPSLRERMAEQLASIPEQPFDPEDDKKHQTLGPTLLATNVIRRSSSGRTFRN